MKNYEMYIQLKCEQHYYFFRRVNGRWADEWSYCKFPQEWAEFRERIKGLRPWIRFIKIKQV